MHKWENLIDRRRLKHETKSPKLERVLLVFAIFNFIVTGLSTLGSSVVFVCSVFTLTNTPSQINEKLEYYKNIPYSPSQQWYEFAQYVGPLELCVGLLILMICSSIAFVFSIILLKGLEKERPNYLKAYLVYGIAVAFLSGMSAIVYGATIGHFTGDKVTMPVALTILYCYLLILKLVRQMYHKLIDLDRQRHGQEIYENLLK